MRTPLNNVVRCVGGYEFKQDEPTKKQPWRCVLRGIVNPVEEYNEFWQEALDDNSAIDAWYDQNLEDSGVQTVMETKLTDNSTWEARLAQLDAQWAELDAQRAEENAQLIAHADQTIKELEASIGNLAAIS